MGRNATCGFMTGIWSDPLFLAVSFPGCSGSTLGKNHSRHTASDEMLGKLLHAKSFLAVCRRLPLPDKIQEKEACLAYGIFFLQLINVKIIIYGVTMFFCLPFCPMNPPFPASFIYPHALWRPRKPDLGFRRKMCFSIHAGHYQADERHICCCWCGVH